jgi:hypothetical protein
MNFVVTDMGDNGLFVKIKPRLDVADSQAYGLFSGCLICAGNCLVPIPVFTSGRAAGSMAGPVAERFEPFGADRHA